MNENGDGSKDGLRPGVDYIGVGVGAMVFDGDQRVFLARRGPWARNEVGTWEFPGGGVHFGENLQHAICREFLEEYGMRIEPVELLGIFDHILKAEGQHWVSVTYIARHVSGVPKILEPQKCTAIEWHKPEQVPNPVSEITRKNIDIYRNKTHRHWNL